MTSHIEIDLDHLLEVVFVKFLHCKVTLPYPLLPFILYSLGGSPFVQFMLKKWSYVLPPLGWSIYIIYQNSAWQICLFPPIYSSYIYINMDSDIYGIICVIIKYYFIFCSLFFLSFGLQEFFQLSAMPLWHALILSFPLPLLSLFCSFPLSFQYYKMLQAHFVCPSSKNQLFLYRSLIPFIIEWYENQDMYWGVVTLDSCFHLFFRYHFYWYL